MITKGCLKASSSSLEAMRMDRKRRVTFTLGRGQTVLFDKEESVEGGLVKKESTRVVKFDLAGSQTFYYNSIGAGRRGLARTSHSIRNLACHPHSPQPACRWETTERSTDQSLKRAQISPIMASPQCQSPSRKRCSLGIPQMPVRQPSPGKNSQRPSLGSRKLGSLGPKVPVRRASLTNTLLPPLLLNA